MGITAPDEALRKLSRFAGILADVAIPEGFLGPNEERRIVSRHVLESCALVPLLPANGPLIDVGSGAGLPGIPIACLRDEPVTLLDSHQRRTRYLDDALRELGVRGEAVAGRAEELARSALRGSFAAATCRALAPPPVVLELCLPFVAVGGVLVWPLSLDLGDETPSETTESDAGTVAAGSESDPRSALPESRDAGKPDLAAIEHVASQLGGGAPEVVGLEVPGADAPRWAMIVHKFNETPERFPRRTGVPARRPLE